MKILLVDDDMRDVHEAAEVWRIHGHEVIQVCDWHTLPSVLEANSFDAVLIDLMIPAIDLPLSECNGGFTTGEYLYRTYVQPKLPKAPFALFSSALFDLEVIKTASERLHGYPNYRGYFEKGCSTNDLLNAISK